MLRVFSMEVPAREKDDLKEEPIVVKLRKVSPARAHIAVAGGNRPFSGGRR